ncbi:protein of unknown function [Methylocaldum szegediense]|uniref:Uncharacterized protein n=1 Tax=Methylocaldum szegediense TaxID=73780 RepID=A0ABN8XAC6_9GAMM|nr:protein of unknown function [Methylocaldum szegediense]
MTEIQGRVGGLGFLTAYHLTLGRSDLFIGQRSTKYVYNRDRHSSVREMSIGTDAGSSRRLSGKRRSK